MKQRLTLPLVIAALVAVLILALVRAAGGGASPWPFIAVGIAVAVVLVFAVRFEASSVHARVLAIVALLGTLSALLRVPFAAIPNLQPSTYLVMCSGYVFGPVAGFAVGALTAIVSNFFLGHGPWTLFQVLAWGLAGASAAGLRRLELRPHWLGLAGIVWGALFGLIMNVWTWIAFVYPLTAQTFLITWMASIPFDMMHAAGNAFFLGLLGVRTIRILERYHARFCWSWEDGAESQPKDGPDGASDRD
ncbi:MAG: ECF transporter S component [Dehalococcoidia bacterium]|nr:ECF transporter S component [Dehalococcoidia bacterium]